MSRRYTCQLLIPHTNRVLLLREGEAFMLPTVERMEPAYWQDVRHIATLTARQIGPDIRILRCFNSYLDDNRVVDTYAAENTDLTWHPGEGGIWASVADISTLTLLDPENTELLHNWFDWWASPKNRFPAWYRPGWLTGVQQWVQDAAGSHTLAEVRTWGRAYVAEAQQEDGTLFFKAVPEVFRHEVALARLLHAWHPNHTPEPVALSPERGFMLTRDFGGELLAACDDITLWEQALRTYAALQIDLASRVLVLRNVIDSPNFPPEGLMGPLGELLADGAALQAGPLGLAEDEISLLRGALPTLRAMLDELARSGIPLSLDHGDFHSSNVFIRDGQAGFFDWSDSSLTHPFFSLPFFLAEIEKELPNVPEVRSRLRDAYLSAWTAFAPLQRLRTIYSLAERLAGFHKAILYHKRILPGISVAWEVENMLPYHLRISLERLQL